MFFFLKALLDTSLWSSQTFFDGLRVAMEHYTLLNCTILLVFGQPRKPIFTGRITLNLEEHHAHSWLVYTLKQELVY